MTQNMNKSTIIIEKRERKTKMTGKIVLENGKKIPL
jgi:hypothetical protein